MIKQKGGFTVLELLVVMAIMAILTNMAYLLFRDFRYRTNDTAAVSDARNLITVATEEFVANSFPDFTHGLGDGSSVGLKPDGTYAFTLSGGVKALIVGMPSAAKTGYMEAWIHSEGGTNDPAGLFGKCEFYCVVDEEAGVIITANF